MPGCFSVAGTFEAWIVVIQAAWLLQRIPASAGEQQFTENSATAPLDPSMLFVLVSINVVHL